MQFRLPWSSCQYPHPPPQPNDVEPIWALFPSKEESFTWCKSDKTEACLHNTQSIKCMKRSSRLKFGYLRARKNKNRVALSGETGIRSSGKIVTRPRLKHNSPRRLMDTIIFSKKHHTVNCRVGWDEGRRRHNWFCNCNSCNYRGRRSCRVVLFGRRRIYWGGERIFWWFKQ